MRAGRTNVVAMITLQMTTDLGVILVIAASSCRRDATLCSASSCSTSTDVNALVLLPICQSAYGEIVGPTPYRVRPTARLMPGVGPRKVTARVFCGCLSFVFGYGVPTGSPALALRDMRPSFAMPRIRSDDLGRAEDELTCSSARPDSRPGGLPRRTRVPFLAPSPGRG